MLEGVRSGARGTGPSPRECRAALARIVARIEGAVDARIEGGWAYARSVRTRAQLVDALADALEQGRREREQFTFFATVGHELRTPLTSIRGFLETLADGGIDATTAARFLRTARSEALRLTRFVENMFEFSLLDLSTERFDTSACDVSDSLSQACDVVRPLASARGIGLTVDVTGQAVAAIGVDACLHATINLLDNAIKYAREGGVAAASVRRRGAFVEVIVEDDGPGVAAAECARIFELRARGSGVSPPGAGIGLAIVRMIARRAGGDVVVDRGSLGGARFTLALPAKAESEPDAS